MKDIECIILEDNIEYGIIEKIKYKEREYLYLSNINNPKDFCIRKVIGKVLFSLDDETEYNFAMELLKEKHIDILTKLGIN